MDNYQDVLEKSIKDGYARAFQSIVEDQKNEIFMLRSELAELKERNFRLSIEMSKLQMRMPSLNEDC